MCGVGASRDRAACLRHGNGTITCIKAGSLARWRSHAEKAVPPRPQPCGLYQSTLEPSREGVEQGPKGRSLPKGRESPVDVAMRQAKRTIVTRRAETLPGQRLGELWLQAFP